MWARKKTPQKTHMSVREGKKKKSRDTAEQRLILRRKSLLRRAAAVSRESRAAILGNALPSHDAVPDCWSWRGGFVFNNLSIPSSVDPTRPSSSSSSSSSSLPRYAASQPAREQNVPAPGWEEPITGRVIYTEPRGGCCLPSNTGQGGREGGERAREYVYAWESQGERESEGG